MENDKKILDHLNSLINLHKDFLKQEKEIKQNHINKISYSSTSREICRTSSIKIECFDNFINHLIGCITVVKNKTEKQHEPTNN